MREAVIIALAWLSHFDHGGRSNHSIRPEMTERRFPPPWSIDDSVESKTGEGQAAELGHHTFERARDHRRQR
jgi:hypothetical protein